MKLLTCTSQPVATIDLFGDIKNINKWSLLRGIKKFVCVCIACVLAYNMISYLVKTHEKCMVVSK